ncbi:MAG: RluA family pseudouridine synthase [Acidobacteria bacterium]|nr:RluA family pseudouridine synthase [Acidobacteriota bacterium]
MTAEFTRSFIVEESESRVRLDHFLEQRIVGLSRGRIRSAILRGEVTVDGQHRESGRRLLPGQHIEVAIARTPPLTMIPEEIPLSIVHEDDDLLVVDKPSGMFVHPTHRVHAGTLLNAAAWHLNHGNPSMTVKPLLVHRLDRATSGLLVMSKTATAHARVAKLWMERRVEKRYIGLVAGRFAESEGVIDAPIGSSREQHPGFRVMADGRPALTKFREIERLDPWTLVEMEPLTGRTNQLRIHAAHAGAALAGDDLHGQAELAAFRAAHPAIEEPSRLFLHASMLRFQHPATRVELELHAGLPEELEAFLDIQRRQKRRS